jgi:hypothetical protein
MGEKALNSDVSEEYHQSPFSVSLMFLIGPETPSSRASYSKLFKTSATISLEFAALERSITYLHSHGKKRRSWASRHGVKT